MSFWKLTSQLKTTNEGHLKNTELHPIGFDHFQIQANARQQLFSMFIDCNELLILISQTVCCSNVGTFLWKKNKITKQKTENFNRQKKHNISIYSITILMHNLRITMSFTNIISFWIFLLFFLLFLLFHTKQTKPNIFVQNNTKCNNLYSLLFINWK